MSSWPGIPPDQPEIPPPWRPQPPAEPSRPPTWPQPPPRVPVPLVPFSVDAPDGDLLGALLRRRIVMLSGFLTGELATSAAAQVMTLDADNQDPIRLHVATADGDLNAALALADVVALTGAPVTAVAAGTVGGPGLAPFAAAQRRIAHRHATFRLSSPRTGLSGSADEIAAGASALQRQVAALSTLLASASGRPVDDVAGDMRRGRILSAVEARDYGLVHEVAQRAAITGTS